ncbi:uncharacterized protein LOC144123232 [Amblyomma americanum]
MESTPRSQRRSCGTGRPTGRSPGAPSALSFAQALQQRVVRAPHPRFSPALPSEQPSSPAQREPTATGLTLWRPPKACPPPRLCRRPRPCRPAMVPATPSRRMTSSAFRARAGRRTTTFCGTTRELRRTTCRI